MAIQFRCTDEFTEWLFALDNEAADFVSRQMELMREGQLLGGLPSGPGTHYALRELQVLIGERQLRVFYAFDARLSFGVFLIGGDTSGMSDEQVYKEFREKAGTIWLQVLSENTRK